MGRQSAVPSVSGKVMNLRDYEVANGGLVAAIVVFEPEGGFLVVDVQVAGSCGEDRCRGDMVEAGPESQGAFFRSGQLVWRHFFPREEDGGARHCEGGSY